LGSIIKKDTLYDNLEILVKKNILIKKSLPSKGKKGRPASFYEKNKNAVYDQFELLEDLLDACGFDPIHCDESGNPRVVKCVCLAPEGVTLLPGFERIRSKAFDGGHLGFLDRPAKSEDFEKTWRLEKFIEKLKDRCQVNNPAYMKYREDREYQEIIKACKKRGLRIPAKEDIIHKKITFQGQSHKHFILTNKNEEINQQPTR
jgi:hypothetical protein